jgi:hypothetical protein
LRPLGRVAGCSAPSEMLLPLVGEQHQSKDQFTPARAASLPCGERLRLLAVWRGTHRRLVRPGRTRRGSRLPHRGSTVPSSSRCDALLLPVSTTLRPPSGSRASSMMSSRPPAPTGPSSRYTTSSPTSSSTHSKERTRRAVGTRARTGWPGVDLEIGELRRHFRRAGLPQRWERLRQGAARAEPRAGSTRSVVEVSAPGPTTRRSAGWPALRSTTQHVKHSHTPTRREAGIAADPVIQLANMLRRLDEAE